MATVIYIDDVALPMPTKYNVSISDLDSSDTTRNELGVLIRNRVRQGANKVELGFTVTGDIAATILSLVVPDKVRARYFNPNSADYVESEMYVGDRNCEMRKYVPGDTISDVLWNVSFNLVEY